MSTEATTAIYRYSKSKGSARLVLLAMGDEANGEGLLTAYKRSHGALSHKANIDRSSVARAVKTLVDLGELRVLQQGNGRASTDYQILLPGLGVEGTQDEYPAPAGCVPRVGRASTQGAQDDPPIIPFSPSPAPTSSDKGRKSSFPAIGEFHLTPEMRAWAAKEVPGVDLAFQTRQFADHWRGKGEKRADWVATWRTWMRNAGKWSKPSPTPGRSPTTTYVQAPTAGADAVMSPDEYELWMDELEAERAEQA